MDSDEDLNSFGCETSALLNNTNSTRYSTSKLLPNYPSTNYGSPNDKSENKVVTNSTKKNTQVKHVTKKNEEIGSKKREECVTYTRRWYILLVFWLMWFTQVLAWNTWGPIALTTKDALGWVDADIALLSNWGCITYVFSAFFFSWLLDTKGLRVAVVSAATLNFIGTAIRCLPVGVSYLKWTAHLGQIFIGLAGPVCQGGSPSISATWFPVNQRTTSTAIATVAAILGTSFSFLIGPKIVTEVDKINQTDILPGNGSFQEEIEIDPEVQERHYREILMLLYIECGMALFLCILILIYFPAKPPTPPSISASAPREDFKSGALKLLRHREFWLLGMAYAQAIGVGQAWMTQIVIIFEDTMKVAQDTTGMITFYASIMGIVGALFFGGCVDFLGGKMKLVLLLIQSASLASFIWYLLLAVKLVHFNLAMLYVCVIILFFLTNGTIPLYYEITVEASYPVAEGIVTLTITWLMNVFGLVFLFVFMIPGIGASWMNYVMLGAMCLSIPLLALHKENYARRLLDVDNRSS